MTTLRDLIEAGKVSLDTVVLGALPMTADGALIGHDDVVLFNGNGDKLDTIGNGMAWGPVAFSVDTGERYRVSYPFRLCYSTREAAQSAAEKGGG